MKVKATRLGYYDLKRKRPDEVFLLKDKSHFSSRWMVSLEDESQEEGFSESKKPASKKGKHQPVSAQVVNTDDVI